MSWNRPATIKTSFSPLALGEKLIFMNFNSCTWFVCKVWYISSSSALAVPTLHFERFFRFNSFNFSLISQRESANWFMSLRVERPCCVSTANGSKLRHSNGNSEHKKGFLVTASRLSSARAIGSAGRNRALINMSTDGNWTITLSGAEGEGSKRHNPRNVFAFFVGETLNDAANDTRWKRSNIVYVNADAHTDAEEAKLAEERRNNGNTFSRFKWERHIVLHCTKISPTVSRLNLTREFAEFLAARRRANAPDTPPNANWAFSNFILCSPILRRAYLFRPNFSLFIFRLN